MRNAPTRLSPPCQHATLSSRSDWPCQRQGMPPHANPTSLPFARLGTSPRLPMTRRDCSSQADYPARAKAGPLGSTILVGSSQLRAHRLLRSRPNVSRPPVSTIRAQSRRLSSTTQHEASRFCTDRLACSPPLPTTQDFTVLLWPRRRATPSLHRARQHDDSSLVGPYPIDMPRLTPSTCHLPSNRVLTTSQALTNPHRHTSSSHSTPRQVDAAPLATPNHYRPHQTSPFRQPITSRALPVRQTASVHFRASRPPITRLLRALPRDNPARAYPSLDLSTIHHAPLQARPHRGDCPPLTSP